MVLLLSNTAEGGTDETAAIPANTGGGSGNAFDTINIASGSSVVFDNARAAHGSMSYRLTTTATPATAQCTWDTSMGTLAQLWFRANFYLTAAPAANIRLALALSNAQLSGDDGSPGGLKHGGVGLRPGDHLVPFRHQRSGSGRRHDATPARLCPGPATPEHQSPTPS
ncbi:MAG TPA: hypothetical protein VK390_15375 [Propionibacteriaceae bacterium]|nr:hypothetical protein [Propionibacteriaceae bacterium]